MQPATLTLSTTLSIVANQRVLAWTPDPAATIYYVHWLPKTTAPAVGDAAIIVATTPAGTTTWTETNGTRSATVGRYWITDSH